MLPSVTVQARGRTVLRVSMTGLLGLFADV